ncbi:uncharacterized protein LOC102718182 isoform X2 [Oryza brachyantha]|uniref:uncharacterized protein LOC102718182 isoform X2 n=1 Tax=Oryza brachyantha TaxID=4533 RepID=UPI001ADACF75|nr:uncharacterized protein LOC102718182 isoform X2 [Oryza brachyantha]
MAKFTFDDADEDPPVASGAEKRKRDAGDDPVDGEAPRPRNSAVAAGSEQAVPGEGLADGEVEGAGLNVQIDPDVLDCSICFDSLRPPLYQHTQNQNHGPVSALPWLHRFACMIKED